VLLGLILVAAAGLRFRGIEREGLWLDELYSLETSASRCYQDLHLPRDEVLDPPPRLTTLEGAPPVARVWTSMDDDQHPPLYFVLLRLWREALGSSDAAVRSLSVVASLAGIVLLFDVGRLLLGTGPALWACALMAVSQGQILYAQEARSYTLLIAEVLAAASAVVRIERFGVSRWRLAGLCGATLAIVLTHYFGVAGCAAVGAYALIRLRGRARVASFAAMGAAAVLFCAAWLPWAIEQSKHYGPRTDWARETSSWSPLAALAYRVVQVPVRWFADPAIRRPGPLPGVMALILFLPLLRLRSVPGLLLPALWAVAWLAVPGALDVARSTHLLDYPRYAVGAAPAAFLLAAGLLADRREWVRHVVPGALVLYCVASLPWTFDMTKPEYRLFAQDLGARASDGDLVVFHAPAFGDWYAGGLYLAADRYAPDLRAPAVIATRPLSGDTLDRARAARAVWVAHDRSDPDLARLLPGFRTTAKYLYHGVGFLYRLEPDAPVSRPRDGTSTSSTPTTRGT
jgi:hypothetical protein